MLSPTRAQTQPSPPPPPGNWRLSAGRAMTLLPREAGVLRLAQGRLWATCDGPHSGALNESGDHILDAGAELRLRAGEHWVIEAWNGDSPAYFSWDPLPVGAPAVTPHLSQVLGPLADLRQAFLLGTSALVRLAVGLAGLAGDVARLPRIIPGWPGPSHPSTTSSAMKSWM